MISIENIECREEVTQAGRSRIYHLLSQSWEYPGSEFIELVKDDTFVEGLRDVAAGLPYAVGIPEAALEGRALQDVPPDDMEAEYIRVFSMGPGGPPCPLREGSYAAGRQSVVEELIRFYNHFGLSTTKGRQRKLPDDLSTELEFLHYLTFLEMTAVRNSQDPSPYRRAERDFLERRLLKWLPQLNERIDAFIARGYTRINNDVIAFYRGLADFTETFARCDLRYVAAQCTLSD